MSISCPKKNLIIVGNKPPHKNIGDIIDSYDFVIRINCMNYLGLTGRKIDGLYLEANNAFKYMYFGGKNRPYIKKATQIFMNGNWLDQFQEWPQYITNQQYRNIEIINDKYAIKDIGFFNVTSPLRLLAHLLNTKWGEEYNISITCLDIENRANFIINNDDFLWHRKAATGEQEYLIKLLTKGAIKRVYEE